MASIIPWSGARRGDWSYADPFDLWDPFTSTWPYDPFDLWDRGRGNWHQRDVGSDVGTAALARAHVDWRETPDAHLFLAELPGVRKEEVRVEVEDGGVLRISGERNEEEVSSGGTWRHVERRRGSFLRRLRLPENAKPEEIRASMENGLLTVTVPKREGFAEEVRTVRSIDVA